MSTDDEDSRPGARILLVCLTGVLVTGAAMAVELTTGGPWRYPCAAATAAATLLLVRPASGPVHAWGARRRTARARRTADSLRLEQMHERTLRRPSPRATDSTGNADPADRTTPTSERGFVADDADTRSIDLDAIRQ